MIQWKAIGWGVAVQVFTLLLLYYIGNAKWLNPLLYALLLSIGLILGSFVAARRSPGRPALAALIVPLPTLAYIIIANATRAPLSTRSLVQLIVIFIGCGLIAAVLASWQRKQTRRP